MDIIEKKHVNVVIPRAAKIRTALLRERVAGVDCARRGDGYAVVGPLGSVFALVSAHYPEYSLLVLRAGGWQVSGGVAAKTSSSRCPACDAQLRATWVVGQKHPVYHCGDLEGRCALAEAVRRFGGEFEDYDGEPVVALSVLRGGCSFVLHLVFDAMDGNMEIPASVYWVDGDGDGEVCDDTLIGYVDDVHTVTHDALCELVDNRPKGGVQ